MKTKKTVTKKSISAKDKGNWIFDNIQPLPKKTTEELGDKARWAVEDYLSEVKDKEMLEDFKDLIDQLFWECEKKIAKK